LGNKKKEEKKTSARGRKKKEVRRNMLRRFTPVYLRGDKGQTFNTTHVQKRKIREGKSGKIG